MRPPRLPVHTTNAPPKRKRRPLRPPTPPPNEYDPEKTPEPKG